MPEESYIRGAGAVRIDSRRTLQVLALSGLAILIAITIWMFVSTASDRSQASRLRSHGVPVTATVTGCTGVSSGIGMGVEYYECRGSYTLDGSTFEATIRGSRALLRSGQTVAALAVPGDAASLALPNQASRSSGGSYTIAIVLAVITALAAAGTAVLWRGRRRSEAAS